ncbi:hypothetical protein [Ancylomarina sp.]|uniref:hypothetical protein n=1 Tax=Ancylomarina sp. TaxID=1970196 RepID=UPI00356452E0
MRISKNNDDEGLKTFNNIALRDEASETFNDGDLIKVIDASDDPNIKSGWAIYRYQISSKSYDLIEKEEKEEVKTIKPDFVTTTNGALNSDRNHNTIVAPYAMRPMHESFEILEDFDLEFSFADVHRDLIRHEVRGMGRIERSVHIPVNTKEGKKYLRLGRGALKAYSGVDDNYMHWGLLAEVVDDNDPLKYGNYQVNNYPDGKCIFYNQELDGIEQAGRIPIAIVRCELNSSGRWDNAKLSVFKLWKNYLKKEVKLPEIKELPETTIDNRTIVKNASNKLVSFHDLNHGTGFEFPSSVSASLDSTSRADNFALNWTGYTYGKGIFKYKNVEYKLGLNSANFTPAWLVEQYDIYGDSFHYTLGAYLGQVYFPCLPLVTKELPSLEPFDWNGKMCVPILVLKFIFNEDKTVNWDETQISRIYRNGTLIEQAPEITELPETIIDNKTIVKDADKKICSFHELNHGAGFEFPSNVEMKLKPSNDLKAFDVVWTGLENGVDVFKYKNLEYKLGLRTHQIYSSNVKKNCDTLGFTHYMRMSCYKGYIYWSSMFDYSSDFPSIEEHVSGTKIYIPIAIIKFVFNPDYTINLSETQVSHIYKNGLLIEGAPNIPKLDLGVIGAADISSRDKLRGGLYNGQLVKVINAAQDPNIKSGWASYRYIKESNSFELVGQEHIDPASKAYSTIADRDTFKAACFDGELVKVIDASSDPAISSGWAFYRFRGHNKSFELVSKEKHETAAAEVPSLQEVTDKGYRTTNRVVIRRDGVNSYGHTIEDETGSAKHSQNILDYAGHYELAGKDKSIGISLNGEGIADFKKSVSTAALKVKTGAAAGKIAICKDAAGNVIWGDMPKAELPPIEHNYPDGLSCDYTVTNEAKHKFSVPDAIKGFRSDMRILKDFDFNISIDYKTINFALVGANPTLNIPVVTKDGQQNLQISPLSLVMQSANQGKTVYIPVFKRVFPTVTGDAYYLGNASQQNGVQVFSDGTTDTMQLLMQIRVTVPTDWNNFNHSDITVYKYWKKALGTFDELMNYR